MTDANRNAAEAALNDTFRAGVPYINAGPAGVPGRTVVTCGIDDLAPDLQARILVAVRDFTDFSEDNDPCRTRDFGAFDMDGAGKIFWKIDVYENADCEYGDQHPADPGRSYRVMTVMLASEY